jgi:hypothetical protein
MTSLSVLARSSDIATQITAMRHLEKPTPHSKIAVALADLVIALNEAERRLALASSRLDSDPNEESSSEHAAARKACEDARTQLFIAAGAVPSDATPR